MDRMQRSALPFSRLAAGGIALLMVLALLVASPSTADAAGDAGPWPQGAADADGTRQAATPGPSDPGLKWYADLGEVATANAPDGYNRLRFRTPVLSPAGDLLVVPRKAGDGNELTAAGTLVALDADTGAIRWEVPDVSDRCGLVVDSQGRIWVQRTDDDEIALEAVDADGNLIGGTRLDDVLGCARDTQVNTIGGETEHLVIAGGRGDRELAAYDVSGAAPIERWVLPSDDEFGGALWGPANLGLGVPRPLIVGSSVYLLVDSVDGENVELVEIDLASGAVQDRMEIAVHVTDGDPGDAVPDDVRGWHPIHIDGRIVFGLTRRSRPGTDYSPQGYLAAIDLGTGLDELEWQVPTGPDGEWDGGPNSLAKGDGVVVASPPGFASNLVGFSITDGSIQWVGQSVWGGSASQTSFATDSDGSAYSQIQYPGTISTAIAAVGPTGTLRWVIPPGAINDAIGDDDAVSSRVFMRTGPIHDRSAYFVEDSTRSPRVLALDNSGGLVEFLAEVPDRVSGSDRFETAADICAEFVAPGPATVYVATGGDFPDALTGGVPAALTPTCMLLTIDDHIPPRTIAELERLAPASITVLGGSGAVPASVVDALGAYTDGPVHRLSGPTRFETSAAISANTFSPADTRIAFVATGLNFPDALAGVPVGAAYEGPILLVTPDFIPPATRAELDRLDLHEIVVLGGSGAVSDTVLAELGGYAAEVRRASGPDRFATSVAVGDLLIGQDPPSPLAAFVATGIQFPDALAGGAVAGAIPGPIYLVAPDFAPPEVTGELGRISPDRLIIFGGTSAVSPATEAELRQAAGLD